MTMANEKSNSNKGFTYLIKLLAGPIVFALLAFVIHFPGMEQNAQNVLGIFGWMIVWWATQPIPWMPTCLLPL